MSGKLLDDGPSVRAAVAQRAYDALVAAVEEMQRILRLNRETPDLLEAIKQAMHVKVPPNGLTVIQTLSDRERQNVFNEMAAVEFPAIRQEFENAIQDFIIAREGRAPTRKVYKTAGNAWKADPGADRRTRQMQNQSPTKWRSPYRGRPEHYDPGVVLAFKDAIAHAADRKFTWTRSIEDNKSQGAMLYVLVAAIRWAMCIAWQSSAPPGRKPPNVRAEGLLKIIKAERR